VRYRYTLAAGLVFLALFAWVLTHERGRVPEKGEVFGLDVKDVTRLEIHPRDGTPVTLEKRGEQWWLTAPFEAWASKDEVERLARDLCELKPDRRPKEDPHKAEWGLDNPELTVKMWCGRRKFELALGKETPVGSQRYARIEGRPGLYLVASFIATDLQKKPEDLRDKKLAHYERDQVQALDLQTAKGTFRLEARQEGDKKVWQLVQPIQTKADHWTADTLVTRPSEVEARGFEAVPKNLAEVGLDRPTARLTLHLQNGKALTVLVGKQVRKKVKKQYGEGEEEQDVVYAMLEGRPELLLVEASFASDLNKDLMDLRDKHVLALEREQVRAISVQRRQGLSFSVAKRGDTWFLDTPQPGKAKQTKVDDLLWNLEDLQTSEFIEQPKDLKQYGLVVPDTVVSITLADGKTIKVLFGYKTKDNRYYCKTSLADTVYVVSDLLLSALPTKVDDIKSSE
jgi:hypothetical protein